MEYNFISIEEKWQRYWREKKVYSSSNNSDLPKYYVLDMFPYPSGSGLHVGHPLGYIASDIISRYKRTKGQKRKVTISKKSIFLRLNVVSLVKYTF